MAERLQKILAAAGLGSRRTCEQWIKEGRVSVDGQVITQLGTTADRRTQKIALNGRVIPKSDVKRSYIAVNKPRGYACTLADVHAVKLVTELVDLPGKPMLRPVGRLDVETEGLLFLSDDGDFIYRLTHPKFHIEKTYRATVRGVPTPEELDSLREGVFLEDGHRAKADHVRLTGKFPNTDTSDMEMVVHEGRNRMIRQMCSAIGHSVARLVRIKIGFITIGSLPPGTWRHLTPTEVARLTDAVPVSKTEAPVSTPLQKTYRRTTTLERTHYGKQNRSH